MTRGQRVFCSSRGQRGGCGGTFSIFLAGVLPRHTVTATLLWQLLCRLLANISVKSTAQAVCPFLPLETCYHLLGRLRLRLDAVRCLLCQRQKPPVSSHSDPLLQTAEHLQSVFPVCPLIEFQLAFQQALLG